MPLALKSCQAGVEESAAASSTTDLARVCGQQSQPPLLRCNIEVSGVEKHLFYLSPCLGGCASWCVHPANLSESPTGAAALSPLGGTARNRRLCSFSESRDFSRLHLWKVILQAWTIFSWLLFVQHEVIGTR